MNSAGTGITVLLRAWGSGDQQALESVMPLVYKELQATAHSYLAREGPGHILQSMALVNETYLRLAKMKEVEWQDRAHFYGICARLMREILTDYARSRLSLKRGKGRELSLDDEPGFAPADPNAQFLMLDSLLQDLSKLDERMCQIVQYRAFVGATVEETASALGISERTVKREWRTAKAWLTKELHLGKRDRT